VTEGVEGLIGHRRSKVGSPNSNVHYVRDPVIRSNPICERFHGVKYGVNMRYDIQAIDFKA
jgi:hypothetical protein